MTKKAARRKQINKDTKAQKRRKKRLQHYGVAPVTISKHWNRQKTLEQNYAILGLSTDANKAVSQEAEERVGVLTEGACRLRICVFIPPSFLHSSFFSIPFSFRHLCAEG